MTIRHLKIFIAVAETGSMSRAAQKLFLSQPTVSQAIRELAVRTAFQKAVYHSRRAGAPGIRLPGGRTV